MFQIYIFQDNKLVNEITSDCIIGACHDTATDSYPTICYTDCDLRTKARTILSEAQNVKEHLTDEIVEASYVEDMETAGKSPNGKGDN